LGALLAFFCGRRLNEPFAVPLYVCGWAFLLVQAFLLWRGYRLDKARRYWSGREYERRGRYALAPEYWDSEDALLTAWRRKRG
jgi:hypothetical protein